MKVARFLIAAGIVVSSSTLAEPYAPWGVFADGTPLSEFDTSTKIPAASDVPIPLAPGGVFVTDGGDIYCDITIRTERSVKEVCAFYRSELDPAKYQSVDEPDIGGSPSCAIYQNGQMKNGTGIWVYKDMDPLVVINGSTLIHVSYKPPAGKLCND